MSSAVVVLPIFGAAVAAVSSLFLNFREPLVAHVAATKAGEAKPTDNARTAAESATAEVAAFAEQMEEYANRPLSVSVLGLPGNRAHDSRWQKHTRRKYATMPARHRASVDRPAGIPAGLLISSQR